MPYQRVYFLVFTFLATVGCLAGDVSQGWDYQYQVELLGTRSESIVNGRLLFNGEELPKEYEHVVTPIGEFVFIDAYRIGASKKAGWLPFGEMPGYSAGSLSPAYDDADVKALLDGKPPRSRITNIEREPDKVCSLSCVSGTLDSPPIGMGKDWFYVVNKYLWVNPKNIDEVIKGIMERVRDIKELPFASAVPGKPGYADDPYMFSTGYTDVRGIPSGTAMRSLGYPGKWFRVPPPVR